MLIIVFWRRVVSLLGCQLVLLQVLGVGVVLGAALVGGADGGWRDWWVAAVVGLSVVGEVAVVGVSVGAGDGVARCADGGGWEGDPYPGGL